MSRKLDQLRDASRDRLAQARAIADDLRHDPRLHELAMTAVFVLEDCLFELEQSCRMTRPAEDRAGSRASQG